MVAEDINKKASEYRLGIDLGGTKIEIVVLHKNTRIVYRKRVKTKAYSYEAILKQIAELVLAAETELQLETSIGIGTPGSLSPRGGLLRNSNTTCMNGKALKADIETLLGRRIKIQNDANCLALSEALTGAGKDAAVVFGVIIGTGTGGGLVVNRELLVGLNAICGEWGHNPLPWHQPQDGLPACYCGKSGCIETFLSGPGLISGHQRKFETSYSSQQIVELARDGDLSCQETMGCYYDQMARSLAHVINILDPNIIVLGGGMSNISELYHELPARLESYVFSDYLATAVVPALHGDASGVFGAAML